MAEKWAVLKVEGLAGAPTYDNEAQALGEASIRANKGDELLTVVRVIAEVKRDPEPPAVITRFE
jgi:hypothetical protein